MIRIKICGITRVEDALAAADAGVHAIGLNFHADSPRHVVPERARELCAALPPFVVTVGLFVDASAEQIEAVLSRVPLQMLQFHGEEPQRDCVRWGRPWLKALRMRPGTDVDSEVARYPGAAGLLLDSYRPGVPGGTGETFDWARVPAARHWPLVLAGGLHAGNVADAIAAVQPDAVDVSGGVESDKGIKDAAAMRAFVAAVRGADAGGGRTDGASAKVPAAATAEVGQK